MLVLSRKLGEQIVIGDGIVVTVVGLSGQRIRIGVQAPTSVVVRRSELPAKPPAVERGCLVDSSNR